MAEVPQVRIGAVTVRGLDAAGGRALALSVGEAIAKQARHGSRTLGTVHVRLPSADAGPEAVRRAVAAALGGGDA